jgi:multidrug efflux pump subunit AcrB
MFHIKLLIYDVSYHSLFNKLKSSFNENNIGLLKSGNKFIPIIIGEKTELISDIINQAKVANNDNKLIPVKSLISISNTSDYKTILAGKEGEYIPINLSTNNINIADIEKEVKSITNEFQLEASYTGSIIRNRKLLKELSIVLLISVLLLYFILAAQFESLTQPLIVLLEILFDFSGALILLILFGYSLNIMSAIGIIVMSGIIINDSILKIDTINKLRRQNVPLLQAIKIGGKRRLKPIIMTSLTTILALFPLLLYSGIGAELQIPLALAVIGGMTIGTIVSLYFIPLAYWLIYKRY